MSLKEAIVKSVESAPDGIAFISVSEFSLMISRLVNIVHEQDKTLVISNKGEDVAVVLSYDQYIERVIGVKKNREEE